jgi:hypothetical protein
VAIDEDILLDEEESTSGPLPPMHDASMVEDIVKWIKAGSADWEDPSGPISVGSRNWTPALVHKEGKGVLHVHVAASMPRYVKTRLVAAADTQRVYIAVTMEALYDEEVLRILCDTDAYVILYDSESTGKPAYYLAALADRGIPVSPELRRELARNCWQKRAEGSNFEKGRLFEGLLAFLLSSIRGFRISSRNFNGVSDEIDIVVRVDAFTENCWSESGVPFVIVEAKNWKVTVGSPVVTLLLRKLETRRGRARIGLLFATSSFSDEARSEELKEAKGNLCVVMVGPTEISQWIEAEDPTAYLDNCVERAMLR